MASFISFILEATWGAPQVGSRTAADRETCAFLSPFAPPSLPERATRSWRGPRRENLYIASRVGCADVNGEGKRSSPRRDAAQGPASPTPLFRRPPPPPSTLPWRGMTASEACLFPSPPAGGRVYLLLFVNPAQIGARIECENQQGWSVSSDSVRLPWSCSGSDP